MKRPVTEERVFCDEEGCKEPGYTECMVCDKDLCSNHRLELVFYLNYQSKTFRASLCPHDAQPLLPFLSSLMGKSTSERKAGHNPEFNEARLREILAFLMAYSGAIGGGN